MGVEDSVKEGGNSDDVSGLDSFTRIRKQTEGEEYCARGMNDEQIAEGIKQRDERCERM